MLGAPKGVPAPSLWPVSLLSPAFTSDRQQLPQEQCVTPVWGQPGLAQSTPGRARVSQQVHPQPGLLPAVQRPSPVPWCAPAPSATFHLLFCSTFLCAHSRNLSGSRSNFSFNQ